MLHYKISEILTVPTADRPNWSLEEITKDPIKRLDAKYWIKKKEEDEQKKD